MFFSVQKAVQRFSWKEYCMCGKYRFLRRLYQEWKCAGEGQSYLNVFYVKFLLVLYNQLEECLGLNFEVFYFKCYIIYIVL